ncbi:hypothetical protein CRYUN_Cryun32bG0106600 [Craigia yunnanensis]
MMRRSASKKTGQPNSTNRIPYSPSDLFRIASSKASSKEMERIDNLFYSYAKSSSGMIDPEGIETLCSDMEVDHTNVRILMLAWKMKAEKQGYFTLEEWRRGLKALRADTVRKLRKALPELEKEVMRPSNFVDFYSYSFRYCLTEEKQKSIDIESICQLLDLVLGSQFHAQVDYFIEYLKVGCNNYCILSQRLQLFMLSILDFLEVTVYTCTSSSVIMGNEFISVLADRILCDHLSRTKLSWSTCAGKRKDSRPISTSFRQDPFAALSKTATSTTTKTTLMLTSWNLSGVVGVYSYICLKCSSRIDFHLVQLFFACMPLLAVYLVAQYARYEMRKMEAKQEEEEEKKKQEEEEKAKETEQIATDSELSEVKVRLGKLEEAVKAIVVESKKQSAGGVTKNQQNASGIGKDRSASESSRSMEQDKVTKQKSTEQTPSCDQGKVVSDASQKDQKGENRIGGPSQDAKR